MHPIPKSILKAFTHHQELSTSQLVSIIFPKEFSLIKNDCDEFGIPKTKANRKLKAMLHRKLLYHLNRLVDLGILRVSAERAHGEKFFVLNLREGEEIILKDVRKNYRISKPHEPNLSIVPLLEKKLLIKLHEETWYSRLNALAINSNYFTTIEELKHAVIKLSQFANDGISIYNFDRFLNNVDFIEEIAHIAKDNNINFTIEINEPDLKVIQTSFNLDGIKTILCLSSQDLEKYNLEIESLLNYLIESKKQIFIKNKDIHPQPYILGYSGPYTFNPDEWNILNSEDQMALCCAKTSIGVDFGRLMSEEQALGRIREVFKSIAKSMIAISSYQRTYMLEYFSELLRSLGKNARNFFKISNNYIRLWNYGLKESDEKSQLIIPFLRSLKEEINNFCSQEESIYKSCGMPTRFRISFSYLSRDIGECVLSKSRFERLSIKGIQNLYEKKFIEYIKLREEIARILDGGDRTRFYRFENLDAKAIIKEWHTILTLYRIPLFCYDFRKYAKSTLKLTEFF